MDKEPIVFSYLENETKEKLDEMYGVNPAFLRVQPSRCLLPPQFVFYAQKIRDLKVYEDDVWMVSFPRTGSHWMQEMVWCIGNEFDYEKSRTHFLERCPLLESSAIWIGEQFKIPLTKLGDPLEYVAKMPRPRYIKTHLPWALLPQELSEKKPKIIYGARNPKDTCVSFYHYCRTFHNMQGSFDEFAELMLRDNIPMAPFWKHVLPFWKMRDQENILFLMYEKMKRDQAGAIKKTATFLGKNVTDEQIVELCEHLKFSKMATNPSVNLEKLLSDEARQEDPNYKFIRKGKVGDWINYMSKDLSQRFDEWTEEHLRGTGLQFHTDLVGDEE
ncbi:PREDICTED: sulfotransferase family cytosolic 1B member 1-like [Dinoponera quadriceps]|uniref:Sulfotransferase family cytosolic 1B member 1-like n=1 Tax=Dinoponera quadriceps TaxID=609295 RepID=A0A6P3Y9U1_DINQU|nr:PREDICTED: sulfotransferase family cytosolic 1B member 1-like [Dinoponera quadriceps]